MGSTLITVELVIIGLQVLVWIGLLLWAVLGSECISLCQLKHWVPVVAIGVLGLSHTLGIVFDRSVGYLTWKLQTFKRPVILARFMGFLTSQLTDTKRDENGKTGKKDVLTETGKKELYIIVYTDEAYKYLEKLHRQKSLLRATFFNTLFVLFVLPICLSFKLHWVIGVLIVLAVELVAWLWTWYKSSKHCSWVRATFFITLVVLIGGLIWLHRIIGAFILALVALAVAAFLTWCYSYGHYSAVVDRLYKEIEEKQKKEVKQLNACTQPDAQDIDESESGESSASV